MSAAELMRAADALTTVVHGPFAIVRTCRICGHSLTRRRGGGRGAGLRDGNKQRGEMYRHIRDEHHTALHTVRDILDADGWQSAQPNININDLKELT